MHLNSAHIKAGRGWAGDNYINIHTGKIPTLINEDIHTPIHYNY